MAEHRVTPPSTPPPPSSSRSTGPPVGRQQRAQLRVVRLHDAKHCVLAVLAHLQPRQGPIMTYVCCNATIIIMTRGRLGQWPTHKPLWAALSPPPTALGRPRRTVCTGIDAGLSTATKSGVTASTCSRGQRGRAAVWATTRRARVGQQAHHVACCSGAQASSRAVASCLHAPGPSKVCTCSTHTAIGRAPGALLVATWCPACCHMVLKHLHTHSP